MMRVGGRSDEDDRGAAMVEFAIVLPLLVMLTFGIIEFGRAFNTTISLRAAAREGARAAALANGADVEAVTRDAAPSVDIDTVTVDDAACAGGGDGNATVTATKDFSFLIPLVPLPDVTLTGEGVMRCGV
jgi:Flp pilus assembly protein TadG